MMPTLDQLKNLTPGQQRYMLVYLWGWLDGQPGASGSDAMAAAYADTVRDRSDVPYSGA